MLESPIDMINNLNVVIKTKKNKKNLAEITLNLIYGLSIASICMFQLIKIKEECKILEEEELSVKSK
jgi:hypothetical protein